MTTLRQEILELADELEKCPLCGPERNSYLIRSIQGDKRDLIVSALRQAAAPNWREAMERAVPHIEVARMTYSAVGDAARHSIAFVLLRDIKELLALTPAVAPDGAGEALQEIIKDHINSALRWRPVFEDGRGGNDLTAQQTSDLICGRLYRTIMSVAALAQAQEPREDADQIALDAARQIEALPGDLHKTQKTGRIQLIILAAMNASSRLEDATEGYNPVDDRMQFPRKKPDAS